MHHFFMFFCLVFSSTIEANTLYIFDKNGDPLKGAYIFFPEKNTYKNKTHIIKQKKYQFSPKVSVINKGDSVIFPNKDNFLHHIYSFSKTGVFEFYIEKGNNSPPFDFNTPGIAILGCNIHDTMAGFIHILEDEGFALSNRKGIVKFDTSLPDKLYVWHENQPQKKSMRAQLTVLTKNDKLVAYTDIATPPKQKNKRKFGRY